MDQLRHPLEPGLRLRMGFDKGAGCSCGLKKDFYSPVRVVLCVTVAGDEMPHHHAKASLRNNSFIPRADLVVPFAVKVVSQETDLGHVGV